MSAMHYSPIDEHDELIMALLAGRWWAIMELEDLLCSSSKKKECRDLTSGQWRGIVEAPQGAPVTPQYQQGEIVPARSPEEDQEEVPMPGSFPEAALVATMGQEDAPVPILSPEEVLVADGSPQGAPVPARQHLKGKLKIPQNMRLSLRDTILTPLPLRPPKGPPPRPAKYPKGAPVPASSPGEAPVPTRSPEEAPVPTSAQVEAPVPKETPVASSPQEEESVSTSSPEEALVADGSPQGAPLPARHRFREKMKVSENKRLFLKRDVILTPLPLRPPKGPGPPPRPAKTPKGAAVPASSAGEVPVLFLSPEEVLVADGSPQGAPVPARQHLKGKLKIPQNMRLSLRDTILTPLPLRPPKGPPPRPAKYPKGAPVPASSPGEAPVPTWSPEEAPVPTSAQVEVPVPKETPVASSPQEDESVSTSSPEEALMADGSPQGAPLPARHRFRGKMKVSENKRLFLKRDVILTPLPLRPPKGPGPPPRPAKTPKGAAVPASSAGEVPVLFLSPEEVLVADGFPQGAPVPARQHLKGKLKIPQNMRLSLRDTILTPLPLRPPKGPPPRPAKYPKGAPVPASSPGEAPVPTRSPEEAPVPTSAQVEVPVPKETPVASLPQEEESVSTSSPEEALVADGSPQGAPLPARHRFRGKMKVSENKRLFLKRDVILTPLPLRPPKGPGPPPRPAKTPKGAAVPASSTGEVPVLSLSPKKGPVPTSSQTKAPMPASSQEEAPVSTATAEEVLVPARSPEKVAVPASSQEGAPVTTASLKEAPMPAMSLKRSPRLSVSLQGATKSTLKRPYPWSTKDLENADVVQLPPHKRCVRKDTHQHILKRPCPWSTETSDSEDVIQLPLQKKQPVGKEPKDTIK